MVIENVVEERFWIEWEDRFEQESGVFLTPQHPEVIRATSEAIGIADDSDIQKAMSVWDYIYENVEYKLSKKWKTPVETLRSGIGDCEDVTFLAASMLARAGVEETKLVIGDIIFPDGQEELHTWNRVNGTVIDTTGSKKSSSLAEYKPQEEYTIRAE